MFDAIALAQQLVDSTNELMINNTSDKETFKDILLNSDKIYDWFKLKFILDEFILEINNDLNFNLDEWNKCIDNINHAAIKLDSNTRIINTESINGKYTGAILIRKKSRFIKDLIELRICIAGNVDSGKSTLISVLTNDQLDDGRGKARSRIVRLKHEADTGRTSYIGTELIGFDSHGNKITPSSLNKQKILMDDVCKNGSKLISLIDLAGHERYLKTTLFGMTGCMPDFVVLVVGANAGIIGMTKEHLGIAVALQIPVIIVITKIDMCPPNILKATIDSITKILKSSSCRKIPYFIKNINNVITSSYINERMCPIFQISNVTGEGLDIFTTFLNLLNRPDTNKYNINNPVEFRIADTFSVPGVGTVVHGTLYAGIVNTNDTLLLGPDEFGNFVQTIVKSIHHKRVNTNRVVAGQTATFALKKIKRSFIRKGMVMLAKDSVYKASRKFQAEILILHHSSTIKKNYTAVIHSNSVRQSARIIDIEGNDILRTGNRDLVTFCFVQYSEYIKIGDKLIFREGKTKGIGKIVKLL